MIALRRLSDPAAGDLLHFFASIARRDAVE